MIINGTSPTIVNNIFEQNGVNGIVITQGGAPSIRDNLILNNQEEGIHISTGSFPTIEGNLIHGNGSWAIYAQSSLGPLIRDNVVIGNDRGIYAGPAPEVTGNLIAYNNVFGVNIGKAVKNNIIIHTDLGILRGAGSHQVKSNNIIVGGPEGIEVYGGTGDSLLNNVIIGCEKGIVVYSDGGEPPIARNNTIVNNEWGVYCYPSERIDLRYNDVWGNTIGDYYNCTPGEGSASVDPGFVDPDRDHYALSAASPLIDRGDPTILDPDGTRSGIGAYGGPDALPFALTLIPRDTVLTRGADSLLYDVILSNTTGLTQQVQAWTKLILASREAYPGNPIVGPVPLELGPHETVSTQNPIAHPIPPNAPTGIYEYRTQVGHPPGEMLAGRDFYFDIRP